MRASLSKEFRNTVKNVLANVEKRSGVAPDNPDFVALRSLLKRRVREIESSRNDERPLVRDWTRGRFHSTRKT
jgi:hypothetical protein